MSLETRIAALVSAIGADIKALFADKQNALVSGTNLKTVGGHSLLGGGDIAINATTAIRLNPQSITADATVPSDYNGASVGPITISDGCTVTVQDNATWSIH